MEDILTSSENHARPCSVGHRVMLREHYLFSKFAPSQFDRLCGGITTKSVKRGEYIFAKGDPGTSLFAVVSGTVKISVPAPDGKVVVFNLFRRGDIFGEIALLDGNPRTADAIAINTDCELLIVKRQDFVAAMREEPEIAIWLIETLCSRLRRTTDQAEDVLVLDLAGRLARTLMRLLDDASASMRECKISITQKLLAELIGVSRESTNKQLRLWEKEKWVRLERSAVVVLAVAPLVTISRTRRSPRLVNVES
jgi:CRP-like cAMP-binding protein